MFKKNAESSDLEKEITRVFSELAGSSADSPEYSRVLEKLVTLHELRPKKERNGVSADALLNAIVNVLGIGAVLHHEKLNVITSKAFSWIKPLSTKVKP